MVGTIPRVIICFAQIDSLSELQSQTLDVIIAVAEGRSQKSLRKCTLTSKLGQNSNNKRIILCSNNKTTVAGIRGVATENVAMNTIR